MVQIRYLKYHSTPLQPALHDRGELGYAPSRGPLQDFGFGLGTSADRGMKPALHTTSNNCHLKERL